MRAAAVPALPDAIGTTIVLSSIEPVRVWGPDDMYEHINGEAELLKRYGTRSLAHVAYEGERGDYVSVDVLDLGTAVNAYALYRLYTGCDGDEYQHLGATVAPADYTWHLFRGPYFIRMNVDILSDGAAGRSFVDDFVQRFSRSVADPEPLPVILGKLQELASTPCEVDYHPDDMDYDLEAGPGYSWIGPGGDTYFVSLQASAAEAERYGAAMRERGVPTVVLHRDVVIWSKESGARDEDYLQQAAAALAP